MRHAMCLLLLLLPVAGCGPNDPVAVADVTLASGEATLIVHAQPFGLELRRAGQTVARTLDHRLGPAVEIGLSSDGPRVYLDPRSDSSGVTYHRLTIMTGAAMKEGGYQLTVATDDPARTVLFTVAPEAGESFAFAFTPSPASQAVHVRLNLAARDDEHYFGLGEYFDAFEQRGKVRDVRFVVDLEIESGYNEAHVPVPSYVSTASYGLFLDNREPLVADMAASGPAVRLTVVGGDLRGHLFTAATPLAAIARQQRHAGLPPLWPAWMFGPQQWRNDDPVTCSVPCEQGCKATRTGADIVLDDARTIRKLKLPGSVIWIDAPWMTALNDFTFNPVQFPDAKGMIAELHKLGFQVVTWAAPFINQSDDRKVQCGMVGPPAGGLYTEAADKGFFVKGGDGQPYLFPWRNSSGALLDFTNPAAFAFWKSLVKRTTDLGVVGYKLDWDEYIVAAIGSQRPDFRFADGSTAATQHAVHHELFHKAHQEALIEAGAPGFLIVRSGDATDARYASSVWPGDLCNGFETHRQEGADGGKVHVGGLPAAVNAAVSLAASAHPHFGSDIGGFRHGLPKKEALARWIEFGALSTIMQLGGGGESHNPWDFTQGDFDQELLDIYRRYARLHTALFPYLYTYVKRNSDDGTPILRAPALMFPDDAALAAMPNQYFFGDDLLVAPVVENARSRMVALPKGRWVHWFTRQVITGPKTVAVDAPLDLLPLFARAGAIVPLLPEDVDTLGPAGDPQVVTMEARAGELLARVFPEGKSAFALHDGTRFESDASAAGMTFSVTATPRERRFSVEILWSLTGAPPPKQATRNGGASLPFLPSLAAWQAAPEGAFHDAATGVLWLRFKSSAEAIAIK
ncbi:MAG: glycoside hydrolase family 31 protein [Myxococcales bacterium]|nr:glycoside hydrolase family 31 protein [Myxococcales bacterium]